jgi:D-arabinose 1-dehydrogenase-like Zn-dependent alcohol dehydrogenase
MEEIIYGIAKARAVDGPGQTVPICEIERRELDEQDVLNEIKYAGICHSDTIRPMVNGGMCIIRSCRG